MTTEPRDMRMSDAEREEAVAKLNSAVSEGRLTLPEFEERIDGVLRARTYGEVEPYLHDLPSGAVMRPSGHPDVVELRSRSSSLARVGPWVVPHRLVLEGRMSKVKLDFTSAVIAGPVVELELDLSSTSLTLILPPDTTVNIDGVEQESSSVKIKAPQSPVAGGLLVRVTGLVKSSALRARPQRRFWRWRW